MAPCQGCPQQCGDRDGSERIAPEVGSRPHLRDHWLQEEPGHRGQPREDVSAQIGNGRDIEQSEDEGESSGRLPPEEPAHVPTYREEHRHHRDRLPDEIGPRSMHPSPHQEAGNSQAGLEVVGRTGFNVERVGDGQVVSSLLDPTQILHLVPGIGPNRPQPNSCRTVLGGQDHQEPDGQTGKCHQRHRIEGVYILSPMTACGSTHFDASRAARKQTSRPVRLPACGRSGQMGIGTHWR